MSNNFDLIPVNWQSDVQFVDLDRPVINIGRDVDNDVLIDQDAVSRRHACILWAGSKWVLVDMGSTNHSYLNGKQLIPRSFYLLRNGDTIELATAKFKFVLREESSETGLSLLVFAGEDFEREVVFPVDGSEFVIGAVEGDLVLDQPSFGDERLVVYSSPEGLHLCAGQSRLQVMVNGVITRKDIILEDRTNFALGIYTFVVVDNVRPLCEDQKNEGQGQGASSSPPPPPPSSAPNLRDLPPPKGAKKKGVLDWAEETEDESDPFNERANSFKHTVNLRSSSSSSQFGKVDDDSESVYSSLRDREEPPEEIQPLQIILGAVSIILILATAVYLFIL